MDTRFVKREDCYVDTKTGLEWNLEDEPDILTWDATIRPPEGWRVPTLEELVAIIDYRRTRPATELPGIHPRLYWPSTAYANIPDFAWGVEFSYGSVTGNYMGLLGRVRLVRTGENPSGGCPYCHGDAEVAEIAIRMGFRPDVAFCRVRELEREIKAMEVCTLGKV